MRAFVTGRPLLALAAALLVAGAAGARSTQQISYQWTIPAQPTAANGVDPSSVLPKPRECDPALDLPGRLDYFPLARLRQARTDNPFVRGEPFTIAVDLVNRKRQRFRIYVSGAEPTVRRYVSTSSACLERFLIRRRVPQLLEPVRLDRILIAAATAATGVSEGALAVRRDALAGAGPVTFEDVVVDVGGDVPQIVEAATAAAQDAVAAKVAAGEITAAEAAVDVRELMARLAAQPGAPFLYTPGSLPASAGAYGTALKRDRRALVIAFQPLRVPARTQWVTWFAVDPNIGQGVTHAYRAKCRTYVEVWIKTTAGSATVTLWRVTSPPWPATSKTAVAPNTTLPAMTRSATPARLFDTRVVGNAATNTYSIYGAWVIGANELC